MLAFLRGPQANDPALSEKVARSLGLFFGAPAPSWGDSVGRPAARRAWRLPPVADFPPRQFRARSAALRAWKPGVTASGALVLFHGALDNCAELASELGVSANDPALVYGAAVDRWGDRADLHAIGHYCSIVDHPGQGATRLARSPYYAPPLHYFVLPESCGAASTPRVLEPMGLERRLNRRRLAESLFFLHGSDDGYLEGAYRVHYGCIVKLAPGSREVIRYYDPLDVPRLPKSSAEDHVREVDRLLTKAAGLTYASGRNPGLLLSGGLDSSNVASRLVAQLPPGRQLHTFTYVPQPGHGAGELADCLIDEGPAVLAFAERYPQLVPHLVENTGIGFDHRLDEMFMAMGTGTVNTAILFRYHGLFAAAREHGCDMLISSDHGNFTFSAEGDWAFSEYLRRGKLIQLWRAVKGYDRHPGSLFWRFCSRSIVPMLPDRLWRLAMRLRGGDPTPDNMKFAVREGAIDRYDLAKRARAHGTLYERNWYATRRQHLVDNFARGDVEGSDILQGFEQLYEVATRDATAYRPLIEYCIGLPTEMFRRDGVGRWLARELGKGRMPEAQRQMKGHGQHNTDWHVRYTPKLPDMRQAVAAIREDPLLDELIDADQLDRDLDRWPDAPTYDAEAMMAATMRLPRAIALARYVKFMNGSNGA